MAAKLANAFRITDWTLNRIDPDGLRHVATVSVRVHWFVGAVVFFQVMYRPYYGTAVFALYVLLLLLLVGFNGYIHYRLRSNRAITWRLILGLCAIDVFTVSAAVATGGGFGHDFIHLFYYPALAGFAVIFTSFRLNMAWVTMVSLIYLAISLGVGDGLDIETRDEKALLARIAVMYVVVATVNMVSRFERMRWWETVERERALQRERAELSQAIHDTTAQSAYMVGLGIDTAKAISGSDNPELDRNAGGDVPADPLHHLGAAASHKHGRHIRGPGVEPCAEVPRQQLYQHNHRARRDDTDGSRAATLHRGQQPALFDRAQRPHQRLPACGGKPGIHRPGIRRARYPAVGIG